MALHHMLRAAAGASAPSDPNFENVTLLLTGDGTNGAQNNTFLDSSTNNFTITRNGNTTQGTFSPYGNLWSNYFDGTGDYLTTPSNAAFTYGTANYTIEGWFYATSIPNASEGCVFDQRPAGGGTGYPMGFVFPSGNFTYYPDSSTAISTTGLSLLNAWHHFAAVCNSGVTTLYIDGVSRASSSTVFNLSGTSRPSIGGRGDSAGASPFNGYISNFRVVKGTAVYTSNFTPSTTPLTAISGTSLLTCQSNRFIDNSSNNFTLTVNGNTSVQRFSPFNPTAPYSASTIGGSGYFDGSGDYLSIADNAAFTLGTSNFTYETWFYPTFAAAGYGSLVGNRATTSAFGEFNITISNNGKMGVFVGDNWSIIADNASLAPYTLNAWNHCALVRNGTSFAFFVNGVRYITATSSSSISNNGATWTIGEGAAAGGQPFYGYITNSRLVVGTAVYDPTQSTLTVPTAPLTAITNTSLLCNFTNAGIPDAAMMNDLETVGNAQVSTSVKKYGTGSIYIPLDSSSAIARNPSNGGDGYKFQTGAFTIETWLYIAQGTPNTWVLAATSEAYDDYKSAWILGYNFGSTNSKFQFFMRSNTVISDVGLTSTNTFATGSWNHIAITYDKTTLRMFVNGNLEASSVGSYNNNPTDNQVLRVGTQISGIRFEGYLDDVRITKGYARYTANFTPPAQALPTQ